MRELAKSMVGFSWAVGLFGFQQLNKMMGTVTEPQEVTAAQLDDVSRAAQRHLSDQYSQQFEAGDKWQRRVLDALFDTASMQSFDPRAIVSSMDPRPLMNDIDPRRIIETGMEMMQRPFDLLRPGSQSTTTPTAS
jgi:hypothetical protein